MELNVSKIIQTKGATEGFSFCENIHTEEDFPSDIKIISPVEFSGTVTNLGEMFEVKGEVSLSITMDCALCTKPVLHPLSFSVDERYTNKELSYDDEFFSFEGNMILLNEMLLSNILIHLPMRITCSDKTACTPYKSESYEDHDIEDDDVDPRLSVLKNLFKED